METKIYKTLSQWFPEAFNGFTKPTGTISDYEVLRHFANYTQKLIQQNDEKMMEPFKIINLLYAKSTLYEKNAIENEFFHVIAISEKQVTLKQHIELMPEALRPVYIKTIIEN